MADGTRLLADPVRLEMQVRTVRTQTAQMRKHFEMLGRQMTRSRSFWTGKTADGYRKRFADRMKKVEEILERYEKQAADLERIAGIYGVTEQNAGQTSESLPSVYLA